jgi:hypothetical protein
VDVHAGRLGCNRAFLQANECLTWFYSYHSPIADVFSACQIELILTNCEYVSISLFGLLAQRDTYDRKCGCRQVVSSFPIPIV